MIHFWNSKIFTIDLQASLRVSAICLVLPINHYMCLSPNPITWDWGNSLGHPIRHPTLDPRQELVLLDLSVAFDIMDHGIFLNHLAQVCRDFIPNALGLHSPSIQFGNVGKGH